MVSWKGEGPKGNHDEETCFLVEAVVTPDGEMKLPFQFSCKF